MGLLGATILCGCVPIPHMETYVPEINGRVTTAAVPVVGASVDVCAISSDDARCEVGQSSTTNQQGQFHVQERRHLVATLPLIGDRLFRFEVLLKVDGRTLHTQYAGMGYPRSLVLSCVVADSLKCMEIVGDR